MSSLIRWDPFRGMWRMHNLADRLLESTLALQPSEYQTLTWGLALDVTEEDNEFVVKASIPGINPDDLEITFDQNTLSIQGEVKEEKEVKDSRYHLRERRYGKFARSISLPMKVNADQIEAHYDAGVLTLQLPKAEEVKPKRIAVQAGREKMIEGRFEGNGREEK